MKLTENTEDDDSLKIANSMKRINELAIVQNHTYNSKNVDKIQLDDQSPRNMYTVEEKGDLKKVLTDDSQAPINTHDVLSKTTRVYQEIDGKVTTGDEHIYHKIQNNDLTVDNLNSLSNNSDFYKDPSFSKHDSQKREGLTEISLHTCDITANDCRCATTEQHPVKRDREKEINEGNVDIKKCDKTLSNSMDTDNIDSEMFDNVNESENVKRSEGKSTEDMEYDNVSSKPLSEYGGKIDPHFNERIVIYRDNEHNEFRKQNDSDMEYNEKVEDENLINVLTYNKENCQIVPKTSIQTNKNNRVISDLNDQSITKEHTLHEVSKNMDMDKLSDDDVRKLTQGQSRFGEPTTFNTDLGDINESLHSERDSETSYLDIHCDLSISLRNSTENIQSTVKCKEDIPGNVVHTDTVTNDTTPSSVYVKDFSDNKSYTEIDTASSSVCVKDLSDQCHDKAVQVSEDDFRQFKNFPNIIGTKRLVGESTIFIRGLKRVKSKPPEIRREIENRFERKQLAHINKAKRGKQKCDIVNEDGSLLSTSKFRNTKPLSVKEDKPPLKTLPSPATVMEMQQLISATSTWMLFEQSTPSRFCKNIYKVL